VLINNGAAGMPNFRGELFGLATRIAVSPSTEALYRLRCGELFVEAVPLRYDAEAWQHSFCGSGLRDRTRTFRTSAHDARAAVQPRSSPAGNASLLGGVAMTFEPQKQIGKYAVVREIGSGATSRVYLARDPFAERDVAIKVFLFEEHADPVAERMAHKAFLTESSLAGKLNHPHIVDIYDAVIEPHYSYLVMEYVPGPPWRRTPTSPACCPRRRSSRSSSSASGPWSTPSSTASSIAT